MNMKKSACYFTLVTAGIVFLLSNAMAGNGSLQNMGNGICLDKTTGLMWQIDRGKRFSDLGQVKKYVAGVKLGGYDDWRLTTTQEASGLRGLIAIQANKDCHFPKLKGKYWLFDKKKGTVPARLELECFCRGDFDLVIKDKGFVRLVRNSKK